MIRLLTPIDHDGAVLTCHRFGVVPDTLDPPALAVVLVQLQRAGSPIRAVRDRILARRGKEANRCRWLRNDFASDQIPDGLRHPSGQCGGGQGAPFPQGRLAALNRAGVDGRT